jgi:hypothetical protein
MTNSTAKPARPVVAIGLLLALTIGNVAWAQDTEAAAPAQAQPAAAAQGSASFDSSAQTGGQATADATAQVTIDPNDADPSSLNDFREPLAPYGTWEDDPSYGTVWVPSSHVVGSDFAPYVSAGHWALTDGNEWMWVSDYDWGWAPFHYGRWVWIGGRGWAWIPGRVYAPAWVVWRTGYYEGPYVGWAPMPPTWYWWGGYAYGFGYYHHAHYVFVPSAYAFHPHVHQHIAPAASVGMIGSRSQPYVAAGAPGGYRALSYTRAPSLSQARIPASAIPAQRVAPNSRATAYSRPYNPSLSRVDGSPGAVRAMPGTRTPSYGQPGPSAPRTVAPSTAGQAPGARSYAPSTAPHTYAPSTAPRSFAPSTAPHTYAPSTAPRSFAPSTAPRSYSPAPSAPSGGSVRGGSSFGGGGMRGGGSFGGGARGGGGRR